MFEVPSRVRNVIAVSTGSTGQLKSMQRLIWTAVAVDAIVGTAESFIIVLNRYYMNTERQLLKKRNGIPKNLSTSSPLAPASSIISNTDAIWPCPPLKIAMYAPSGHVKGRYTIDQILLVQFFKQITMFLDHLIYLPNGWEAWTTCASRIVKVSPVRKGTARNQEQTNQRQHDQRFFHQILQEIHLRQGKLCRRCIFHANSRNATIGSKRATLHMAKACW